MVSVSFEFLGHDALMREILRRAIVQPTIQAGLTEAIGELQDRTQVNSSGRPGPNIITGSYHDSWFTAVGGNEAVLSNRQVQALRLEFGFVGVDSLGRHYNQPPYAHLGPAVEEFRPRFEDILIKQFRT